MRLSLLLYWLGRTSQICFIEAKSDAFYDVAYRELLFLMAQAAVIFYHITWLQQVIYFFVEAKVVKKKRGTHCSFSLTMTK